MQTTDSEIKDDVFVDEYTGGLVGPSLGFAATIMVDTFVVLFLLDVGDR